MKRISATLAVVILSIIGASGCTPEQMVAWYQAQGVDISTKTPEQIQADADAATLWWKAQATTTTTTAPAPPPRPSLPPFLVCVRHRESRGDYTAYNASSGASGAFQFMSATARSTALHAGRPDLAYRGVLSWSPTDQDLMAIHLYNWMGRSPWVTGPGC